MSLQEKSCGSVARSEVSCQPPAISTFHRSPPWAALRPLISIMGLLRLFHFCPVQDSFEAFPAQPSLLHPSTFIGLCP